MAPLAPVGGDGDGDEELDEVLHEDLYEEERYRSRKDMAMDTVERLNLA